MSLLIFGSASKISAGIIRRLYGSGAYEKIVCADLYGSYYGNERFYGLMSQLESVQSNTKITDIKIEEKSDLSRAISNASHVVYITHDYYSLVPSKLNLIKTTAELTKHYKTQKVIAVTPVEHDHYGEQNPYHAVAQSEQEAVTINPNLIHLKSDITFGPDSTVIGGIIVRLINDINFYFDYNNGGQIASPIHTDDIAQVVEKALTDDSLNGRHFALEGPEKITLEQIIKTLENYVGEAGQINKSLLEKIISPTSFNLLTERLYHPDYINYTSFLKQYRPLDKGGLEDGSKLGINFRDFTSFYRPGTADKDAYRKHQPGYAKYVKRFLY